MKTRTCLMAAVLALAIGPGGWKAAGGEMSHPERQARLMLLDVDQEILVEQYRHVRMQAFESRLELRLAQIKHRHAPEADRESAEARNMLGAMEERVEMLHQLIHELREEILEVRLSSAELEAALDRDHALGHEHAPEAEPASRWQGVWIGHETRRDEPVRLRIDGDRARFEAMEADDWYEGSIEMERKGDALWEVRLHIERCNNPRYEGKTSLGLARREGNRLTLAANEPGIREWPSRLEATEETRVFVFERERE